MRRSMLLSGLLFAATASAQTEQWLQYHHGAEGRGSRLLELTTDAPPGVALPKLNAPPLFARWTTPMDPSGGRWLCLDRTRQSGLYDRLFFDTKGTGRLDAEAPVNARARGGNMVAFDPVRVLFKGEEGPITYHLGFSLYQFNASDRQLVVQSCGWYEGMVQIGSQKRSVELIDGNVNGAFNDQSANPADCDCVVMHGEKAEERYLGHLLEVDGQLFRIEVAREGAFVKLQKAEGVAFGQVRVPETISEFTAAGLNGHFLRKPAKGQAMLPAGEYRLDGWTIERKDDKGASWTLSGDGFGEAASFTVATNKPALLEIGEPVLGTLGARDLTNEVAFSLQFRGRLDESITFQTPNQQIHGPRLLLTSLDGSFRATNTFEFG